MDDFEFDSIPEQDLIDSIQNVIKYLKRREVSRFIFDIMRELAPGLSSEILLDTIIKCDPNAI